MNYKKQKNKIYATLILVLFTIVYIALPYIALAQKELPDPLGLKEKMKEMGTVKISDTIPGLVGGIIQTILGMVGVLALVMFIYGGILWMTSGGSSEKIKKGKDTIVWAVLGLAFIFFSYAILEFILGALMDK